MKLEINAPTPKKRGGISADEVKFAVDSLFNLYSYLLFDFFEKHEFGSNMQIITSFSILPPIIRYIVLENLHSKHPENIIVIDKLALSILKAFDKEKAIKWINERKEILTKMPSVTEEYKQSIFENCSKECAEAIVSQAPCMYDLCINRIEKVSNTIDQNGRLYNDFESAIGFYKQNGRIEGDAPDIVDFNSIMEFLYLGRKATTTVSHIISS